MKMPLQKKPYIDYEDDESVLPLTGTRKHLIHKTRQSEKNCWCLWRKKHNKEKR